MKTSLFFSRFNPVMSRPSDSYQGPVVFTVGGVADTLQGAATGGTKGAAPEAVQGGESGDEGGEAGGAEMGVAGSGAAGQEAAATNTEPRF